MCQKIPNLVFFHLWIIGNHTMFFKKTLNQTIPAISYWSKDKEVGKIIYDDNTYVFIRFY